MDELFSEAFGAAPEDYPRAATIAARGVQTLAQTGHRFLVALEDDAYVVGAVEWGADDGTAWFDLLVSTVPGAGRRLVREVERCAQEIGCRYVRCAIRADSVLEEYFGRMGYLVIGREPASPYRTQLERRLPLLTVREQRRSDAAAIGQLTGEDAWPFEQGVRPGYFVLSDGERVVGALGVRDGKGGVARAAVPILQIDYLSRGLERWMLERAAYYARTNGFHTIEVEAAPGLQAVERDLEDRRWFRDGSVYRRALGEDSNDS